MSFEKTATCELLSADDRTKVWRWSFESGQQTGMHVHEFDYIAIPISGGQFEATMADGSAMDVLQVAGEPYSRQAGVHHNVKFVGDGHAVFIEIEYLNI